MRAEHAPLRGLLGSFWQRLIHLTLETASRHVIFWSTESDSVDRIRLGRADRPLARRTCGSRSDLQSIRTLGR
jgi:hypothetical protein